jgi:hypothetical protein
MDRVEAKIAKAKKENKLATGNQLDTVSPATRLLEKRRLMYEKQEEFEK